MHLYLISPKETRDFLRKSVSVLLCPIAAFNQQFTQSQSCRAGPEYEAQAEKVSMQGYIASEWPVSVQKLDLILVASALFTDE